jgi:hypothetical protein
MLRIQGNELLPVQISPYIFSGILAAMQAIVPDLDVERIKGADLPGAAGTAHRRTASVTRQIRYGAACAFVNDFLCSLHSLLLSDFPVFLIEGYSYFHAKRSAVYSLL